MRGCVCENGHQLVLSGGTTRSPFDFMFARVSTTQKVRLIAYTIAPVAACLDRSGAQGQ